MDDDDLARRFGALPGFELVAPGLADLREGRLSVPALLVLVGAPRLRELGVPLPDPLPRVDAPEHALWAALRDEHGDAAHGRYNALVRRLVSFERAAALLQDADA